MTMTTGGTGLGLYIARELARAMGGEIEAASTLGHGSAFTVGFLLARPAAGEERRDGQPAAEPEQLRAERLRAEDPLSRSS